jgi:chromate transport protein ChrA
MTTVATSGVGGAMRHRACKWARCGRRRSPVEGALTMLTTILVLLLVLWLLGMVTSYTVGGFIHILLIVAIAMVLIRVIQGRRPI